MLLLRGEKMKKFQFLLLFISNFMLWGASNAYIDKKIHMSYDGNYDLVFTTWDGEIYEYNDIFQKDYNYIVDNFV